ncbi:hypothetical protein Ancab_011977 [Ancistrocladus abbreviatus]
MAEEETEYESDPEEAKLSLKMRRKEASDDEEEEEEAGHQEERERERERREKSLPRSGIDSDGESDGQGGVAEYDDEELEVEEEEVEYYEEEELIVEAEEEYVEEKDGEIGSGDGAGELVEVDGHEEAEDKEFEMERGIGDVSEGQGSVMWQSQMEEGKKDSEPFAVPTAGAFYMHDDRFRDNASGRHRRTFGGRRLWESKDERKWGHDKFEELSVQERHFEEGRRSSRGHYRGRGRARGTDRGFASRNRSRTYDRNNNQHLAPKSVRGRGPRRYPFSKGANEMPATQHKQLVKSLDKSSHATSGRNIAPATNVEPEQVPMKKVVSSLSSASRPFYPSGFPKEEIMTQKRDVQTGSVNKNMPPPVTEDGFSMQQSNSFLQGKNVDSVGMEKLHIDDSVSAVASKKMNNLHMPAASSSMIQAPQPRARGKSLPLSGETSFQPALAHNQVNKVPTPAQVHPAHRNLVQGRNQSSLHASAQQLGQHPVIGSQGLPSKSSSSISVFEPGDSEPTPESSKSKGALVGKGKGIVQAGGRGALPYGGAQVMGSGGSTGAGHGDQNFPATPAFLPVMQFGGQRPGGIGVPAVGMAFPGYVAQPQLGLGNSEMTWLPVLAGAAGALGATYCSPYIAVDGAYHARPTGQTSVLADTSKDNNVNKASNELKTEQQSGLSNDEFSQRQTKPRRYSEMNFGQ